MYIYNNNDKLYYQICRVGLFLILFFLHHHDQTLTCNIALHVPLTILSEDVPRGKARRGARATSRLDANHWRLSPPAALLPFRLAIPVGSPSMLRLALPLPAVRALVALTPLRYPSIATGSTTTPLLVTRTICTRGRSSILLASTSLHAAQQFKLQCSSGRGRQSQRLSSSPAFSSSRGAGINNIILSSSFIKKQINI